MNIHHDWADSMADWATQHAMQSERDADLHADYGPAERHEGLLYTAPQGRVSQGWQVRHHSPEMAVWAPDDEPEREALTPAEAYFLVAAVILSASFVAWLLVTLVSAL